jgi:hypothetical protein
VVGWVGEVVVDGVHRRDIMHRRDKAGGMVVGILTDPCRLRPQRTGGNIGDSLSADMP